MLGVSDLDLHHNQLEFNYFWKAGIASREVQGVQGMVKIQVLGHMATQLLCQQDG